MTRFYSHIYSRLFMDDLQYMFPSYTEDHDHYILKIIIVLKCVCVDIYIYTEEWSSLWYHHHHGGCRLNGGAIWIVFSLYSHYTTIIFPKIMYTILPYITIILPYIIPIIILPLYYPFVYGGYPKLWYPKTALTPRFREPFAPFHVPAESGHGIMIRFSSANSPQRFAGGLYLKTLLIEDPFSKLL